MKARISQVRLMAALGVISLSGIAAGLAEEPAVSQPETASTSAIAVEDTATATTQSTSTTEPAITVVKETAARKLPYGVEDVLKLSQAQVSENITLSYIQNSGTIYDLRPNDIVYLKGQGVSDNVINAMMDQRKKAIDNAAQAQAIAAAAQQQQMADASGAVTAPLTPTYGQSEPVYTEPTYAPESSVYVIPSPAVSYAYYNSYRPYSYGYYGYYGGVYCGAPYRYCRPAYCGSSVVVHFGGGGRSYSHGHSFHR